MRRNYINISVLLFFLLCFFADIWASPPVIVIPIGERKNQFIVGGLAYEIISENPNEVVVLGISGRNRFQTIRFPSTVYHEGIEYSVVEIKHSAFQGQSNLEHINISENITKIGGNAFSNTGISSVFIPRNLTNIGARAFSETNSLEFFEVDSLNPTYIAVDGVLYDKSMTTLIAYPAARKVDFFQVPDGVTHIATHAFEGAQIDSLFIPNSVIYIGRGAFTRSKLSHVVLPENITEIKPLTFSQCTNLRSIIIPNSVKIIGFAAFFNCTNLTSIVIPENVAVIQCFAFNGCTSLDTIQISDNLISICSDLCCSGIWRGAFHNTAWYNSHAEGQVLYLGKILYGYKEEVVFDDRRDRMKRMLRRTRVTVPEGIRAIASNAFSHCIGLVQITLPKSLEYIGKSVFSGCENLRSIHIPEGVKIIYESSFSNSGLREIHVYWQEPSFVNVRCQFDSNREERIVSNPMWNNRTGRAIKSTLVVPRGTKEKYQRLEAWRNFRIVERRR